MIVIAVQHSVFDSAGPQAVSLERLFWFFTIVAAIVTVLVIAAALFAALRRRASDEDAVAPARERAARRSVAIATAVSVLIAFGALWYNFSLGPSQAKPGNEMLTIVLTGRQWWWDVEYDDPFPQRRVKTANEIHIPVGKPVLLKLHSTDVIHSFWAPSLGGKRDLIPGHQNQVWIQADRAGSFRANCAEYCGLQHAHMALDVKAESEAEFAAWLEAQRRPAPAPRDSQGVRGRMLFERGTCASCHNITGTLANASVGPDLTHIASRPSIGAGTLPNDSANLASWIVNAHRAKPGVLMPANTHLAAADVQALVAYLRTLK